MKKIILVLCFIILCFGCSRKTPLENIVSDFEKENISDFVIQDQNNIELNNQKNGLDYQHIVINGNKIELRYSTIKDVEKILGNPEMTVFYETGGEGFEWDNITVYVYEENDFDIYFHQKGNLEIYFNKNGYVIRITLYAEYSEDTEFFGKNINILTENDILNIVNSFNDGRVWTSPHSIWWHTAITLPDYSNNYFDSPQLSYGTFFKENGNIRLVDISYTSSWEDD